MPIQSNNKEKYDTIMLKTPLSSADGEAGIPAILAGINRQHENQPLRYQTFGKGPLGLDDEPISVDQVT